MLADILNGVLGLLRQRFDLGGDNGKALAGFSRAGGFDGGVQGEQFRLRRDRIDQIDDGADVLGGFLQGGDLLAGAVGAAASAVPAAR